MIEIKHASYMKYENDNQRKDVNIETKFLQPKRRDLQEDGKGYLWPHVFLLKC